MTGKADRWLYICVAALIHSPFVPLTPCAAPLLLGSGESAEAAPPAIDAATACSRPTLLTVSSALLLLTEPSLFVTWQWYTPLSAAATSTSTSRGVLLVATVSRLASRNHW